MLVPAPEVEHELKRWEAWDRFLETTPDAGFMQSSWWAHFRATVGYDYFGVTLKDQDAIVGGALVMKWPYAPGTYFYYVQDGPVLPEDEPTAKQVFETILGRVEEHRKAEEGTVSHLRIEPRWQRSPSFVQGFRTPDHYDNYMEPKDTLYVDLRPSEEEILAQMKPKGRYNIRVAQRHGVSVVEDTSERGLADFLRVYRRTTSRQDMGVKPASYFRTLVSIASPLKQASLFFAEYKGRRLATALVTYLGRKATYFFGGSLILHRHVMAPYLLHFEIMRRAKALGYEWYDFWGIAPKDASDHPWQDFSAFKRKFGGVDVNLVGPLDYVYDGAAYERYVAAEKALA
jgi:lipid II:glycine glycyltransferase (peptidoglycan interpeptide bridge formation enzyme)